MVSWRSFSRWPPARVKRGPVYFRKGGRLSDSAPTASTDTGGWDSYVSDPKKPVPYTMEVTTRWAKEYATEVDYVKATHKVHRSKVHPSHLILGTL